MRRRRERPASRLRVLAFLLLAVIASDVLVDGDCDPPPLHAGSASVALAPAVPGASGDPCAAFCVPDCFCCSRSVAAAPAVAPPAPVALAALTAPATDDWPEGVRALVDHPPRPGA